MAQDFMSGLPPELLADQQKILRRQRLAEQMMASSRQPYQQRSAGGYVVPMSPFEGLADVFNAAAGAKMMKQADTDMADLSTKYNEGLATAVKNYTNPQTVAPTTPNDDEGNPMPAAPAQSPRDRIAAAMLSPYAPVRELAARDYAAQNKTTTVKPGERIIDASGREVYAAPKEQKFHVVNGNLVPEPTAGGEPVTAAYTAPDKDAGVWGEPYTLNGQTVQKNSRTGEVRQAVRAPNSTTTTVVNAGPKAFETELGKMDAEQLGKYRTNAEAGQQTLQLVGNMRDAIKQGVFSGGAAQVKTAVGNLIGGLTGVTPKAVPGSQLFNAEASKLVLERIKMLGANPSNADREFIEKTVPNLATSPEARDKLITFLEGKANDQIALYQRADTYARQNRGLGGFQAMPANVLRFDANGNPIQ